MSTRAVTIVIANAVAPLLILQWMVLAKRSTLPLHQHRHRSDAPNRHKPPGLAIDIAFAAAIKTNIRMRVTKNKPRIVLVSSREKRLSIPRSARSMFAQSQRPHQWSRCCGVNCRTPHRRIVINAFYATKRSRTVSSSASNTSGCAAAILAHQWLKG